MEYNREKEAGWNLEQRGQRSQRKTTVSDLLLVDEPSLGSLVQSG